MEKMGLKFIVAERTGIRRFLYPLRVRIPQVYRRSVGRLAVADENDALLPSHVAITPDGVECAFAISLAPLETRTLALVRTESGDSPPIPDPLQITRIGESVLSRQSRLSTTIGAQSCVASVVYDGVEHLAGPLSITLNGETMQSDAPAPVRCDQPASGLGAVFATQGAYGDTSSGQCAARTEVELTCCKSWAVVRHAIANAPSGSVLRFELPLTVSGTTQTCDFGIGNGAYGKLQAGSVDSVIWEIDLDQGAGAKYRIRVQSGGGECRTDYAGEVKTSDRLAPLLWLHWIEPTKSLAVAIVDVATGCERLTIRLGADGIVACEFLIGPTIASPARFGICYHFLDNIPAVAAATNPASILSPPKVTIAKSGSE